jgi:hypothetical protein
MFYDILFGHGVWVGILSIPACFALFSYMGIRVFKLIPVHIRQSHRDTVSYGLATISIFTAVLLASIAVTAWELHAKAEASVSQEAQLAADVLRGSFAMPEPLKSELMKGGQNYLDIVINEEWPQMGNSNHNFQKGWDALVDLYMTTTKFRTNDSVVQIQYADLYQKVSTLIDARRNRVLSSKDHLPPIVWATLIAAAIINIIFLFLFSMENQAMHDFIAILISIVIGFVIAFILAFDSSYEGPMAIPADAYESVRINFIKYKAMYP